MTLPHPDSRVPGANQCVVRDLLDRWAREKPDRPFAVFFRGPTWTFRDLRDQVVRTAGALASLGVKQDDRVIVWLPNGPDCLRFWLAINWLGAVYVPINTAYKGRLLEHVLRKSAATILVASAGLLSRLDEIDLGALRQVVVVAGEPRAVQGLAVIAAADLEKRRVEPPALDRAIEPWDTQSIVYTSGTTGASKGVLSSYAHLFAMSGRDGFNMVDETDRFMCNLPLYHVGGMIPVMGMLARGGSVSFVTQFSTEEFWPSVRETGTTFLVLLGVMTTFLVKRPPGPDDRLHPLQKVLIVPLNEHASSFAKRFSVEVYTAYNMTEISTPLVSGCDPERFGICGRPRPGVSLRIVDGNDCELPHGVTGELIVRTDSPWAMNSGYFDDAEATARAWRNGWFHTGDAFRINDDGDYVFVDRMKDTIRRRGENISSFEVEVELACFSGVSECAVVPVPSEFTEDEILCVVAPVSGQTVDPAELLAFLTTRLPHYMLPRYVRIIAQLPRTPTQKIEKHLLRAEGLTSDCWDREAAGMIIRRDRIGAS